MAHRQWIRLFQPAPTAGIRLYCLPYAGAGASAYRGWAPALGSHIEVAPIQLPGREDRRAAPFVGDLAAMAAEVATAIGGACATDPRPYALFGHSMGALIAYETVLALRRAGKLPPAQLFVSGCRAPQLPRHAGRHDLRRDEDLIARLKELGGTPPAVLAHPDLLALMLPVLRADFALISGYVYRAEPPLAVPLTALGGLVDPEVPRADLAAWQQQTRCDYTTVLFPGDHFYLNAETAALHATLTRILGP